MEQPYTVYTPDGIVARTTEITLPKECGIEQLIQQKGFETIKVPEIPDTEQEKFYFDATARKTCWKGTAIVLTKEEKIMLATIYLLQESTNIEEEQYEKLIRDITSLIDTP